MTNSSAWNPFDDGKTIGIRGSEAGVILVDDEHRDGARITIERDARTAPFAITCGVYGWMVHTRFFSKEEDAWGELAAMRKALASLLSELNDSTSLDDGARLCSQFVETFP